MENYSDSTKTIAAAEASHPLSSNTAEIPNGNCGDQQRPKNSTRASHRNLPNLLLLSPVLEDKEMERSTSAYNLACSTQTRSMSPEEPLTTQLPKICTENDTPHLEQLPKTAIRSSYRASPEQEYSVAFHSAFGQSEPADRLGIAPEVEPMLLPETSVLSAAEYNGKSRSRRSITAPIQKAKSYKRIPLQSDTRARSETSQALLKAAPQPIQRPSPRRSEIRSVSAPQRQGPSGLIKTATVSINTSSDASKGPRQTMCKTGVDDLFSCNQRDNSRGRATGVLGAPNKSPGEPGSLRQALDTVIDTEHALSFRASVVATGGESGSKANLTVPKSFNFGQPREKAKKRSRENEPTSSRDSVVAPSTSCGNNLHSARSVHSLGLSANATAPSKHQPAINTDRFSARCRVDTEAHEDEIIAPLTVEALGAQDKLNESLLTLAHTDNDQSSNTTRDKSLRSETLQKYLQQVNDLENQILSEQYVGFL